MEKPTDEKEFLSKLPRKEDGKVDLSKLTALERWKYDEIIEKQRAEEREKKRNEEQVTIYRKTVEKKEKLEERITRTIEQLNKMVESYNDKKKRLEEDQQEVKKLKEEEKILYNIVKDRLTEEDKKKDIKLKGELNG